MTLLLFGGLEYFQQMVLIKQHVFYKVLHQAVWFMPGVVGSYLQQLLGDVNLCIHLLWTQESELGFNNIFQRCFRQPTYDFSF